MSTQKQRNRATGSKAAVNVGGIGLGPLIAWSWNSFIAPETAMGVEIAAALAGIIMLLAQWGNRKIDKWIEAQADDDS